MSYLGHQYAGEVFLNNYFQEKLIRFEQAKCSSKVDHLLDWELALYRGWSDGVYFGYKYNQKAMVSFS